MTTDHQSVGEDLTPGSRPRGFTGWHRPGPFAPWRRLVEGATYGEALSRLLDAVATGDTLVLPPGAELGPPEPPPRIRRTPGKPARLGRG